jgi:hypothetical protein
MLIKTLFIAVPVTLISVGSLVMFVKTRTLPPLLWLAGSVCLVIVVLAHVAEAMRWFPRMQWGQPDSVGH